MSLPLTFDNFFSGCHICVWFNQVQCVGVVHANDEKVLVNICVQIDRSTGKLANEWNLTDIKFVFINIVRRSVERTMHDVTTFWQCGFFPPNIESIRFISGAILSLRNLTVGFFIQFFLCVWVFSFFCLSYRIRFFVADNFKWCHLLLLSPLEMLPVADPLQWLPPKAAAAATTQRDRNKVARNCVRMWKVPLLPLLPLYCPNNFHIE